MKCLGTITPHANFTCVHPHIHIDTFIQNQEFQNVWMTKHYRTLSNLFIDTKRDHDSSSSWVMSTLFSTVVRRVCNISRFVLIDEHMEAFKSILKRCAVGPVPRARRTSNIAYYARNTRRIDQKYYSYYYNTTCFTTSYSIILIDGIYLRIFCFSIHECLLVYVSILNNVHRSSDCNNDIMRVWK